MKIPVKDLREPETFRFTLSAEDATRLSVAATRHKYTPKEIGEVVLHTWLANIKPTEDELQALEGKRTETPVKTEKAKKGEKPIERIDAFGARAS